MNTRIHTSEKQSAVVIAFGALAGLLSGCASYHLKVDAISSQDAHSSYHSYRLMDASHGPDAFGVPFEQVAADLRAALSSKGLFEAPLGSEPGMIVEVEYGISPARTVVHRVSEAANSSPLTASQPTASGSAQPKHVSLQTVVRTKKVYEKSLQLKARAGSEDMQGRQLWLVAVTYEDESPELRPHLRLMTAAAMDLIGTNSASRQSVTLTENDRRIQFIERSQQATAKASRPVMVSANY